MLKIICLPLIWFLAASVVSAECEPEETIDDTMRSIGIEYLISDDRKLPKENRIKWESDLADYVDFESVNNNMRLRIREALKDLEHDDETTAGMEEKAVLFLVPRLLSDYTRVYLKARDAIDTIESCDQTPIPADEKQFTLCMASQTENQAQIRFIAQAVGDPVGLVFTRTDRWRLSDVESPVTERTLGLIARWK